MTLRVLVTHSKSRLLLASLAALLLCSPASTEAAAHLDAFYKTPVLRQIELSPDGTHIAMLRNIGDKTLLVVQKIESGQSRAILQSDNVEMKLNWFEWANNDRLLVSVVASVSDALTVYRATRLLSLDKSGSETTILVRPKGKRFKEDAEHFSQLQDKIVSLLPDDPEHILVALDAKEASFPGVYRVKVDDERKKVVQKHQRPIRSWIADQQGRVRIGRGHEDTKVKIIVRDVETDSWRTAWEYEVFENSITPLGFGLDPNTLYVEAPHDGRSAVFKVDLTDPMLKLELIHADPEYDVDAYLIHSPKTRDVVGIKYYTDSLSFIYFDKLYKAFQEGIDKVLPDTNNHFVSFSRDETRYIVFSTSGTNPGTYYYGDTVNKQLAPIVEQYPGLNKETLCGKEAIEYETRDGLTIEGFLTKPKSAAENELLPAVIVPHGGPLSKEGGGFDLWSEFLANRGYLVLQMNFRGSSGYGQEFARAGLKRWGREMQDDIIDGTKWLLKQGFADSDRIAIFGGSYGGYAALLGGIEHPELFKCAVSIGGVTDLRRLVYDSRFFTTHEIVEKQIGGFRSDADSLKETSPVHLVEQLKIPVLIAHGTRDTVVPFTHAELMAEALQKHGKPHVFLTLDNGDHYLSLESNRTQFLKSLEKFLSEHIGAKKPKDTAKESTVEEEE